MYQYSDGYRRLVNAPTESGSSATNDLGEYRLYGLGPGDYYVRAAWVGIAASTATRQNRYVPSYFPGTTFEADAQRITLLEGQQVSDVNFGIAAVPVATVSGVVRDESGQPVTSGFAGLRLAGRGRDVYSGRSAPLQADGSFAITLVAPGDYILQYAVGRGGGGGGGRVAGAAPQRQGAPAALNLVGSPMPVTIAGQDMPNLVLSATKGATASGRLVFDGIPPPNVTPNVFMVTALPVDPGDPAIWNGNPNARGDFVLVGLTGQQLIRVRGFNGSLPPDATLKAVRLNGRDVTDQGIDFNGGDDVANIEVVMTTKISAVSGTVRDDQSKPVLDYDVVIFSPDPARWGYRTRYVGRAHARRDGQFLVRGLPPGDYLIVAVPLLETGEEGDPERLAALRARGAPLQLVEGDAKTVVLKLTPDR